MKKKTAFAEDLFKKYTKSDVISPEEFSKLAKDLGFDAANDVFSHQQYQQYQSEVLALLYLCESKNYAEISKAEFVAGMSKMSVASDKDWKKV